VRSYAATRPSIAPRIKTFPSRLPQAGVWFSGLLAEQVRLGRNLGQIKVLANVAGWVLVALYVAGMIPFLRRRNWLLLGAGLYALALAGLWSQVTPRYLVPVAPFLVFGLLEGLRRLGRAATIALLAGVALCNLSLYGVDVWVQHSDDFYGVHYAGQAAELISVADYLQDRSVKDGEVVRRKLEIENENVSPTTGRLFELRGLSLLIGRTILNAPKGMGKDGPDDALVQWAGQRSAKYYLYRPPISPWRVWHFRMPWLQEWVTGMPAGQTNPYYELYELVDGQAVKIDVPDVNRRVDRVPGL